MAASAQTRPVALNSEAVEEVRCEDKAVDIRMEIRLMGLAIGWVEGRGSWSLVSGELQELSSEGTYGAKSFYGLWKLGLMSSCTEGNTKQDTQGWANSSA